MKKSTMFLLVVSLLVSLAVCPALAQDRIEQRRNSLSDTEFHRWLTSFSPEDKRLKKKRYMMLTESDRVSVADRLRYYREWTNLETNLPRPEEQIDLAIQADELELARDWLNRWMDRGGHRARTYESMVDRLIDAGQLEWAAEVIRRARQQLNNKRSYFRRMASIQQALGHTEEALNQFLRAWSVYQHSRYVRLKIMTLLKNNDLDETLLNRVRKLTKSGKTNTHMLDLVEDYLIEQGRIDRLVQWLKSLRKLEEDVISRATEVIDRLITDERYKDALRMSKWVRNKRDDNESLLRHARILMNRGDLDRTRQLLDDVDTGSLTGETTRTRDRVKVELSLRNGRRERAIAQLKRLGRSDSTHRLWLEFYRLSNRYEDYLHYMDQQSIDRPVEEFLIRFRLGTTTDTMLETLVSDHYRDPGTSLALSLAGMSKPGVSRQFLRWLDQYPFDSRIEALPPETLRQQSAQVPKVLLDRWYKRFVTAGTGADTLASWGRELDYPPLIVEAAKHYRQQDRHGEAIRLLEQLLIDHPETMLRSKIESMIREFS